MDTIVRKTAFLSIFFLLLCQLASGQKPGLYISGAVLDADSLQALEGATIKNISSNKVIRANEEGFFRISVLPGDTLFIQQMSYKPTRYLVPADIKGSRFALVQLLQKEETSETATLLSFPTQLQFEQAVMRTDPGNITDKVANLDVHLNQVTRDPTNMQKYIDDYMRYQQLYVLPERGAPNNFINPERWSNFIRDWRAGRFNEEAVEKLDGFPARVKDYNDQ